MTTATLDRIIDRARTRRRLPSPEECRLLRERMGASQAEIAAAVGTSAAAISRYETGNRRPAGPIVERYLAVLDRLREELGEEKS